jgi:hypothetical protein
MILTLGVWMYILWIGLSFGLLMNHIIHQIVNLKDKEIIAPDYTVLSGFSFLIIVLGYWYCFKEIAVSAQVLIFFISILISVLFYTDLRDLLRRTVHSFKLQDRSIVIICLLFFVFVLFASSIQPMQFGTGYYHAQAVQWIEKYKMVPGIANINIVLGYNNSIHLASALFSFSSLYDFHSLNGFLICLIGIRLIYEISKKSKYSFIYIGLLCMVVLNYYKTTSSLGTDIPVAVFSIYIFVFLLKESIHEFKKDLFKIVFVVFFIVTVITIKLSAVQLLPLLIFSLVAGWAMLKVKRILLISALGFIMLSPWALRGITTSGYLIYPYSQIDLFNVDWKVPAEIVTLQQKFITSWTRMQKKSVELQNELLKKDITGIMDFEKKFVSETSEEAAFSWLKNWFYNLSGKELMVFIFLILAFLCFPFLVFRKNEIQSRFLFSLLCYCNIGICIWFLIAPDLRFANGLVFVSLFSTGYLFLELFGNNFVSDLLLKLARNKIVLSGCVTGLVLLNSYPNMAMIRQCWLFPMPYKQVETVEIKGFPVKIITPAKIEDFVQCWNAPIPCVPDSVINFEMRNGTLEEGFRPIKNTKE